MTSNSHEKRITTHIIVCMILLVIGYITDSTIPVAIALVLLVLAFFSLFGEEEKTPPNDPTSSPPTGKTAIEGA